MVYVCYRYVEWRCQNVLLISLIFQQHSGFASSNSARNSVNCLQRQSVHTTLACSTPTYVAAIAHMTAQFERQYAHALKFASLFVQYMCIYITVRCVSRKLSNCFLAFSASISGDQPPLMNSHQHTHTRACNHIALYVLCHSNDRLSLCACKLL